MKKNRITIRFIATFMAFIVAFITMPVRAIALCLEDIGEIGRTATDNTLTEMVDDSGQEVFIVEEDCTKRGQFEKHYLCSDGTFISVTYPEAIHYLDDDNQWQDVDQSFIYDPMSEMYISDKTDFVVSFSNNVLTTNIAHIERNGYAISWGVLITEKSGNYMSTSVDAQSDVSANNGSELVVIPASTATAQVAESVTATSGSISDRLVSDINSFELLKIASQISYENIIDGTQNISLKYTVYHNKIEEDIIISERGNLQSVSMNMDIGPLMPIVNDDGSVDLVDANYVMQFRIGIPYMMDAEYSVCNDIHVTAIKNGTSCVITYTPNEEWFYSSDRVFPIVLDPAVTTNDYVSNIEDTYVEQNTTTNHSSEQFLHFTPNTENGNRRNIIVRVTKLPTIDASMPIIRATLTLTAQYAPFSDISLMARYLDTGIELSEYDYDDTTDEYYSYTAYSYLNRGGNQVTFDFSAHIYEMYSDLEFDHEYGYDYYGDFVIGYSDDADTTYSYPLYSSEYTMPANRPVFTVKYGYTLPAGILDGEVYSFQNCGSNSYMTVNGAEPANNSNIYQVSNDNNIATMQQKFKLEYVSSTGGYLLRSMSSSNGNNKVVDIQRSGGEIYSGRNVQMYSAMDPISQEWLIVPVDYDVFRIVPRANMALTLTAYGYNDGTNSGKTPTSSGNIFVQTFANYNSFQQWYIYDDNDNVISTQQFRASIETGNYFIGNDFTGRYLHRSGNVVNGMSGQISSLGEETVKWQIVNLGDGYCTIQRFDTPRYYLAPTGTTQGSSVRVYSSLSETIPDNYKWSIRSVSGVGCIIQHKTSGLYLTGISSTANPSSVCIYGLNTLGTDDYKKQVWRVANENYYNELNVAAYFDDIDIDVGETKRASVKKVPSSASWAAYSDFNYTITSGGSYVSYDAITHKFTCIKRGDDTNTDPIMVSVKATHKTTGLSDTFKIKVNRNAIIIIPGILGSELYAGQDYGYFKKGMPLISTTMMQYFHGPSTITEDFNSWKQANAEYLTDTTISLPEFANCLYEFLKCNNDGTSNKIISVKKYKQSVSNSEHLEYTDSCGMFDLYADLYEKLKDDSAISDKYYVEFFSYDWRMSNSISANSLNSFISNNNYDKVTLIAHSMGGLVASAYLALGEEHQQKVEGLYYIASPLLGTPEMANVLGNLDFTNLSNGEISMLMSDIINVLLSFVTLTSDPLRNLLCNYQSVYELMPSEYYFSLANQFYMTKPNTFGEATILDYTLSWSKLATHYCTPYQTIMNNNAMAFHNGLFNSDGTHISENVNAFYLYGVGRSTLHTLESVETIATNNYTLIKDTFTSDGDSIVPKWSATLNGVPNNDRIFRCSGTNSGHTSMLFNNYVLSFIDENIQGIYVYDSTDANFTRGYD